MGGLLAINKESGYTSRDVVNIACKTLKTKKIGHTGTLDPLATGVLILCVNEATKLVEIITSDNKEYIAKVILGIKTDTLDITGNIIEEHPTKIEKEQIEKAVNSLKGTYNQEVPAYSAVKINGKKLYEYARNNEQIELPKRMVDIIEIELLEVEQKNDKTEFTFKALVSKGTYIRSLIEDIAKELGEIATMKELTRTKQGNFYLSDCIKMSEIKEEKIIGIDKVLKNYETVTIKDELLKKVTNGALIENVYNQEVLFIDEFKNPIAIYKIYEKDKTKMKPFKMLKQI